MIKKQDLDIDSLRKLFSQPADILGKEKYLNSAVLIPLIKLDGEFHILFEKRSDKIRQGGEVSFPGGEYDEKKDRSFEETAIRETTEELGIQSDEIEILGKLGTLVAPMGVTVDAFVAVLKLNSLDELEIDTNEVERVFALPLDYFINAIPEEFYVQVEAHPNTINEKGESVELLPVKKLGLPGRYAKPWGKGKHRVLVYKTSEETVWGITAEIVYQFCNKIYY